MELYCSSKGRRNKEADNKETKTSGKDQVVDCDFNRVMCLQVAVVTIQHVGKEGLRKDHLSQDLKD